jgi:hypothetical protein
MKITPLALLISLVFTGPVLATDAALVEDVTTASAGVETMDYVEPGKVIRLGPQDSIVLSYLSSCVHERIEGGVITIGTEQSEVQFGKVERRLTTCNSGRISLVAEIASQSTGTTFRSLVKGQTQP